MSIASTDLIAFGSASLPTDDVSTTGGAIDLTRRPVFTDITANSPVDVVSDGADTRTVTVTGRNAAGAIVSDALVLNGTTPVLGVVTFERIHKVEVGTTSGTRTITVSQHSNAATMGTIPTNETGFYSLFRNSASDPSVQKIRYEKFFYKNTHGTLSLLSAQITLTADPSAKIRVGCAPSQADSATVANRLAAPASVVFVDDSVAQNVPATDIAAASTIGVWAEQTLAAAAGALKSTFTTQLSGNST